MIIFGIDPGLATTGYGVVEPEDVGYKVLDYGVISTSPKMDTKDRLGEIYDGLQELIEKYEPGVMGVESLFFCNNQKTAMAVGQARGVVLLAGQRANLRILEFTPMQIKRAVSGYGAAPKNQVQYMVKELFDLSEVPSPDDAADALAVCYCCGSNIK
ncbi:crossover junction endodeoxyribonuclease RuvC [Patescibacteria group bacterium]|nr:crossover junction endodeoxyribonuclease RuvC [Patescibacteria group bacterium]